MRYWPLLCLCLVTVVTLSSCEITTQPTPAQPIAPTEPGVTPAQPSEIDSLLKQLEELKNLGQLTREDIETLLTEVRQKQAGITPLDQDIAVAQNIMRAALDQVESKKVENLLPLLNRLGPALRAIESDLPAAIVIRNMERAIEASRRYDGVEERTQISSLLLITRQVLADPRLATLTPNVDEQVKLAKDDIDAGRANEGLAKIQGVIDAASKHSSLALAAALMASGRGATEATHRNAWRVVTAELEQVGSDLRKLEAEIRPASASAAPAATKAPGNAEAAPVGAPASEGAATAPSPAAQPATAAPANPATPAPQ